MIKKIDGFIKAKEHNIFRDVPSPNFFEGALIGNGGLGVVVCTRPDAVVLRLGHNCIWDIRIDESHKDEILKFDEVFAKVQKIKASPAYDEWFREYRRKLIFPYKHCKYPRPFPCGSLYLFFDRRKYELTSYKLDISNGLVTVFMLGKDNRILYVRIFVSQKSDEVYIQTIDEYGNNVHVFNRIKIEPAIEQGIPEFTVLEDKNIMGFKQLMPGNGYEGNARENIDRGFCVCICGNCIEKRLNRLENTISYGSEIHVEVISGYYIDVERTVSGKLEIVEYDKGGAAYENGMFDIDFAVSEEEWKDYWSKSAISISDGFLERIWYTNTYFIKCVISDKAYCPGIFGNWMYGNIGTSWHGDYHMNYNTQQLFWGVFSSNRVMLHLPYISMIEGLLPLSKTWAKDYYKLNGACFPHSAYPVDMKVVPYPVPDWGWEICETPWCVQSLWWHYVYTKDKDILKMRLFPLIKEATTFLVDYMLRDGANPSNDCNYHIFPTVVPELYGLSENLEKNIDCTADLALTKFLFKAYLESVAILECESSEADLTQNVRTILKHFPPYPCGQTESGEVLLSVAGESTDTVYNVPVNLMPVFPGEDIDVCSDREAYEMAKRSFELHYNEGGNDLVFYNLQGARLGILDIERFKRQIKYCLLPNGTAGDRVLMSGGRYCDTLDFDFMMYMGIWVENFALYAVINECLIQGHSDVISLFPNWDMRLPTSFSDLRTKGAFLVSSACKNGEVSYISILSEKGGRLKIKNPWKSGAVCNGKQYTGEIIEIMADSEGIPIVINKLF